MKCIYCGDKETEVKNSRKAPDSLSVWRRRFCLGCKKTFTTRESALGENLFVKKKNGKHQRFTYEKLFVSIVYAIEKGKGNDRGDQALLGKEITHKLIERLLSFGKKEVSTKDIIEETYSLLRKLDLHTADRYMHYSEYRIRVCLPLRARLSR